MKTENGVQRDGLNLAQATNRVCCGFAEHLFYDGWYVLKIHDIEKKLYLARDKDILDVESYQYSGQEYTWELK